MAYRVWPEGENADGVSRMLAGEGGSSESSGGNGTVPRG
jgi:hypothetical protein